MEMVAYIKSLGMEKKKGAGYKDFNGRSHMAAHSSQAECTAAMSRARL